MKYLEMVKNHVADTASKLMLDLASLLDNALFQLDGVKDDWKRTEMAALREEVFHDFCALCVQNGIPVPAVEETLIAAQAPSADEKTREAHLVRVKTFVEPVLVKIGRKRSAKAKQLRALTECLSNLPSLSGYSGQVSAKQLECVINQMLIELGQEPVRPDYHSRKVGSVNGQPRAEKKVIIVDDDRKEMLKTARALAGWDGLEISFYLYESSGDHWNMTPEKRQAELSKAAQAVVETKSNVVLMDQGLGPIEGDDLVHTIHEICPNGTPVFVANTGGSDDKLRSAGALENCEKGRRLGGVARAVQYYGGFL